MIQLQWRFCKGGADSSVDGVSLLGVMVGSRGMPVVVFDGVAPVIVLPVRGASKCQGASSLGGCVGGRLVGGSASHPFPYPLSCVRECNGVGERRGSVDVTAYGVEAAFACVECCFACCAA